MGDARSPEFDVQFVDIKKTESFHPHGESDGKTVCTLTAPVLHNDISPGEEQSEDMEIEEIHVQKRSFDCITISDSESESPFVASSSFHSHKPIEDNAEQTPSTFDSLDETEANRPLHQVTTLKLFGIGK